MQNNPAKAPIPGNAFSGVLQELHAHAFSGVPGESDSFTLPVLVREYIAYALAIYYQCDHCQEHHQAAIERELRRAHEPEWQWKSMILEVVLFTRAIKRDISPAEWAHWGYQWARFVRSLGKTRACLASHIAFAIGIARADEDLMRFGWSSITATYADQNKLEGAIRDIVRVVVFMKAATSEFRTIPIIRLLLAERGIEA